jgi:hypothetical protein
MSDGREGKGMADELSDAAKAEIGEAFRILREDKTDAWYRKLIKNHHSAPGDPNKPPAPPKLDTPPNPGPPPPPPKPTDPPENPPPVKEKRAGVWWGEQDDT